MKNLICLILMVLNVFLLAAQEDSRYRVVVPYCYDGTENCEAVVIAQSGLKLRSQASFSSKTVAIIPFAEKVKFRNDLRQRVSENVLFDADSVAGVWYRVSWQGKQGFAFSGYLGRGIFKMDKPFYLLYEKSAWCWDDAFISSDYGYYGVYANSDKSGFTIKKLRPTFYNNFMEGTDGGVTFTFRQKKETYFAFASKEPFREGPIKATISSQRIMHDWNQPGPLDQKIQIPQTDWEIKAKKETMQNENGDTFDILRLIIRDKKTGSWHYLFDASVMYFSNVTLDWSGDMDGDGIPDFMLSVGSDHSGCTMLFLSKDPGKWKFVKMAGVYFWGDCC